MNKSDILYMELTAWLMRNFSDVYDEYYLNTYEEHAQKWRDYKKGEEDEQ